MTPILTQSDMETHRKPSELAAWYEQKYSAIRSNPEEVKNARLLKGLYSYFVKELYPLAIYATWRYPKDDVVCAPKIGNQGFDAIICSLDKSNPPHTIEITWPQDGKEHKKVASLINNQGVHGWVGDDFENYHVDILKRVRAKSYDKSLNDYRSKGGSSLLIVLETKCSPQDSSERDAQIRELSQQLRKIDFLVDSIYLITTPHVGIYPVK